jgi:hypothetical protein
MKYRLIDKTTGIGTLCDKFTIDGFDYYVSPSNKDFKINEVSIYKKWKLGIVTNVNDDILEFEGEFIDESDLYKIVCSNNPNINIPKVVDEVERLAREFATKPVNSLNPIGTITCFLSQNGFEKGYNKSQETHPFSEENMIEFAEFYFREEFNSTMQNCKSSKELLQLWKEQKPKIVYYE